ncbi:SDR family NAD(P)-dependent oxidoreductase [Svornostia abyssi]|uniref:SDR family NAD(P)-dependent oxidoreductase n=1 Tax=Svornostia abyssi TaxID=2898438 RepID=A0ABY5PF94_9ACTN|nr:SDR family NAD(P)-dependent oxidoreductase [Parviterribacteraceae bacterium J379]
MNKPSLEQRTVVVTGATSGLGLACARVLARTPGWTVVVAARRPDGAAASLGAVPLALDLADLTSVRAFAATLADAGLPPLAGVVANAGIQYRDRRHTTADGFEATFGTNHLGHFLLLQLLLPHLTGDGRIVVVASGTHKAQRIRNGGFPPPRWDDPRALAQPSDGSGQVAYATSKLANVMTVLELARRMASLRPGSRIAVHGFDPGLMPDTALDRDYSARAQRVYERVTPLLLRLPGVTTAAASGAQLATMITDPAYAGPGSRYVEVDRDGEPSATARDPQLAAELWAVSEELTAR